MIILSILILTAVLAGVLYFGVYRELASPKPKPRPKLQQALQDFLLLWESPSEVFTYHDIAPYFSEFKVDSVRRALWRLYYKNVISFADEKRGLTYFRVNADYSANLSTKSVVK